MANAKKNPWRRGAVTSDGRIPVSARSNAPVNPNGKAIGFFTPATAQNKKFPGNQSPEFDPPLSAMQGKVKP